jgi:hypothetical protein
VNGVPALLNGSASMARDIEACLVAELPDVLDALVEQFNEAYESTLALPVPGTYWRSRNLPGEWTSPGVGIVVARTTFGGTVKTAWDVKAQVILTVMLDAGSAEAGSTSDFEDALNLYIQAVVHTVTAHIQRTEYGGARGVYMATPLDTASLPAYEDANRGQYLRAVQASIDVYQRVRMTRLIPE